MHNICQLDTITWINPLNRFFWEGLCGYGGVTLVVVMVFVAIIAILGSIVKK